MRQENPMNSPSPRHDPAEPSFDFEAAEVEARAEAEEGAKVASENGYQPNEIFKKDGRWYEKASKNPVRNKRFDGIEPDDDGAYRGPNH